MAGTSSRARSALDALLSVGAVPGEPETRRSGRHILILGIVVGTLLSIPSMLAELQAGYTWPGVDSLIGTALTPVVFVVIWRRPGWFNSGITALFVLYFVSSLAETAFFGGLLASGLVVSFGLLYVLGALLTMGLRAALWWFAAFVASIVYAVLVPHWIDPIYHRTDQVTEAATNLIALGIVVVLVLAFFIRQRDRFQQRSDDLLHNILPDEIVRRLKDEPGMIADDVPSASVLFADVVGFTPLSSEMAPNELVGLLDEVFTTIDAFAEELGLEKIKTVGDEYMATAGGSRSGSAATPGR
ncbi:MAG TPA: adenylate/guanylate cyclase domain-containing protein [Actinomycetota bacterium]